MREIKFRAWDIENHKMMYSENGYFRRNSGTRFQITTDGFVNAVYLEEPVIIKPVLIQYTGLKDKNGKEIYEGDILKAQSKAISNPVVKWDKDMCRFMIHFRVHGQPTSKRTYIGNVKKVEVIGNLYENPELLKS